MSQTLHNSINEKPCGMYDGKYMRYKGYIVMCAHNAISPYQWETLLTEEGLFCGKLHRGCPQWALHCAAFDTNVDIAQWLAYSFMPGTAHSPLYIDDDSAWCFHGGYSKFSFFQYSMVFSIQDGIWFDLKFEHRSWDLLWNWTEYTIIRFGIKKKVEYWHCPIS